MEDKEITFTIFTEFYDITAQVEGYDTITIIEREPRAGGYKNDDMDDFDGLPLNEPVAITTNFQLHKPFKSFQTVVAVLSNSSKSDPIEQGDTQK